MYYAVDNMDIGKSVEEQIDKMTEIQVERYVLIMRRNATIGFNNRGTADSHRP